MYGVSYFEFLTICRMTIHLNKVQFLYLCIFLFRNILVGFFNFVVYYLCVLYITLKAVRKHPYILAFKYKMFK